MNILGDNKISLTLVKDFKNQNQIKYINVIYYYMRKLVKDSKQSVE